MKEGLVVKSCVSGVGAVLFPVGSRGASGLLVSLSRPRAGGAGMDQADGNVASVAQLIEGRLGGQREGGACRSEGLVAGQHVPDRLGQRAGELDLGDLGAALAAQALFGGPVALAIERVFGGV